MRASLVFLLLLSGCASSPEPLPDDSESTVVHKRRGPLRIAIVEFGEAEGAIVGCEQAIRDAHLSSVPHTDVAAALGTGADIDYKRLGDVLRADLVIDGGIPHGGGAPLPPRLLSTHSAEVLAVATGHHRADRSPRAGRRVCNDLLRQLP